MEDWLVRNAILNFFNYQIFVLLMHFVYACVLICFSFIHVVNLYR